MSKPLPSQKRGRNRDRTDALSIVFRDKSDSESSRSSSLEVREEIQALPRLQFDPSDDFQALCEEVSKPSFSSSPVTAVYTPAEEHVSMLLRTQNALVKTVRNTENCWSTLISNLSEAQAFPTSTTLLPPRGVAMRAYGSEDEFPVGLIWMLPPSLEGEGERLDPKQPRTTMAWPSGYAAKTEFNMDNFGNLLNGREKHLVSIEELRQQNKRFADVFTAKGAQPGNTEQVRTDCNLK